MRRMPFLLAFALVFASAASLLAGLSRAAGIHRSAVEGFQTAAGDGEGVSLLLNASGDLPGVVKVSFQRDGARVAGGSWTLAVQRPRADGMPVEKGTLAGDVTGGTLTFNGDGALTRADSIRLTIQSGTGQHAGVKSGVGSINLSPGAENPSQLSGTLTLDF
jgi:hypothetical protein